MSVVLQIEDGSADIWKQKKKYFWDVNVQLEDFFFMFHVAKHLHVQFIFCFSLSKNIQHVPKSYLSFQSSEEHRYTQYQTEFCRSKLFQIHEPA